MKKLLLLAGLLWSAVASAQFTPGQLLTAAELNSQFALYAPLAGATFTGSVAANAGLTASAITGTPISGSTGSFTNLTASGTVTLPSGSVALNGLASQAANTIVANGTGSAASPTAIAVPSCSTASSALQWTSGTGLACNSAINASSLGGTIAASYALLASPTFTGTPAAPTAAAGTNTTQIATTANVVANFATPPTAGYGSTTPEPVAATTLSSTGNFTPSQTNGIVGTTTNNNANAGSVGEYITATTSAVSLTTATNTNSTSITLTAGDWDVWGSVLYAASGATGITNLASGISTTSATLPGAPLYMQSNATIPTTSNNTFALPPQRVTLTGSTTIYIVSQATFSAGTVTTTAYIAARRRR